MKGKHCKILNNVTYGYRIALIIKLDNNLVVNGGESYLTFVYCV